MRDVDPASSAACQLHEGLVGGLSRPNKSIEYSKPPPLVVLTGTAKDDRQGFRCIIQIGLVVDQQGWAGGRVMVIIPAQRGMSEHDMSHVPAMCCTKAWHCVMGGVASRFASHPPTRRLMGSVVFNTAVPDALPQPTLDLLPHG